MLRRPVRSLAVLAFRNCLIGVAICGAFFLSGFAPAMAQTTQQDATGTATTSTISGRQIVKQGEPGKFELYVLALSWSPTYCEASRERGNRRNDPQCTTRPYAFVVHGLWPQYERGFPSNCQVPAPRLPRTIAESMLDLMPNPRLVFHEWDRHGTCTGLTGAQYFDTVRKARAAVTIPTEYQSLDAPRMVKPGDVAAAFIRANPGLPRDALQVACDGKRLEGVRICMGKDLSFRECAEVARRSCRADSVVMPPMRGPRAADSSN
jgi:ribonuclease T2